MLNTENFKKVNTENEDEYESEQLCFSEGLSVFEFIYFCKYFLVYFVAMIFVCFCLLSSISPIARAIKGGAETPAVDTNQAGFGSYLNEKNIFLGVVYSIFEDKVNFVQTDVSEDTLLQPNERVVLNGTINGYPLCVTVRNAKQIPCTIADSNTCQIKLSQYTEDMETRNLLFDTFIGPARFTAADNIDACIQKMGDPELCGSSEDGSQKRLVWFTYSGSDHGGSISLYFDSQTETMIAIDLVFDAACLNSELMPVEPDFVTV